MREHVERRACANYTVYLFYICGGLYEVISQNAKPILKQSVYLKTFEVEIFTDFVGMVRPPTCEINDSLYRGRSSHVNTVMHNS